MASILSAGTTSGTALNFSGDTSGVLQLATNGTTTALTLDASQNATFAGTLTTTGITNSGVATATRFNPTGSSVTGNGMYLPAANSLGLSTNGTNAVYIDSSQNVGIGTASPSTKLSVVQNQNGASQVSLLNNTGGASSQALFNATDGTNYGQFGMWGSGVSASGAQQPSNAFVYGSGGISYFTGGTHRWYYSTNTEAMRIDSSGNVGIGTSSPAQKLQVLAVNTTGFAGAAIQNQNTNVGIAGVQFSSDTTYFKSAIGQVRNDANGVGSLVFYNASSTGAANWSTSDERMRIDSSGNLLIGTTSSNGKVTSSLPNATTSAVYTSSSVTTASTSWYHYVGQSGNGTSLTTNNIFIYGNGNIQNTNNSYGAMSDVKLKENIVDATPKLADLMQVKVRNYNLKNDQTHKQIGVIAQELEQIFPSMVEESNDKDFEGNDLGTKTKAVKYSIFVPMLIKAIQELKAINDTQAETINALTARIVAIESKA